MPSAPRAVKPSSSPPTCPSPPTRSAWSGRPLKPTDFYTFYSTTPASTIPDARSVTETTEELWDRTIEVNLKGVFLGSKFAIPEILRSGGGTIINTASIAGLVGTGAEAAYCASKGGVVQLTKQMAIDYAPQGIRVNCICPGAMTEPTRDRRAALDDAGKVERDSLADLNPMHRMGESEEVARAVLFLASEDCSFVNGAALVIDGGYTAM